MNAEIKAALQPGLTAREGDGIKWAGRNSQYQQTYITWQGITKPLRVWAGYMGRSYQTLGYRLRNMELHQAMDVTYKKPRGEYVKPVKKTVPVKDWIYCPPVQSLI